MLVSNMPNFLQGTYEVINKEKYKGVKKPRYLSSWELDVFRRFDTNPNILEWGSETVIIPYISLIDACEQFPNGKPRRYMVDLYVKYFDKQTGEIVKELIEIKPYKQTQEPKPTKGKRKTTYLKEVYTYQVNKSKWIAAANWAKKRGMRFRVITEKVMYK